MQIPQQKMVIRILSIDETVNVNEFEYTKIVSLFPKMGQSSILQYSLDGKFDQLPIKLYPTFIARQEFYKLDLTLKANCRLPAHLRIKEMRVRFKAPPQILRVFVHQKEQQSVGGPLVTSWQDVTGIQSAINYAQSYVDSASQLVTTQKKPAEDPDRADFNTSKRRVEWTIKNFRGGQNRELELSLTYAKGTVIDEV